MLLLAAPFQAFAASTEAKIVVDGEEVKLDVAPFVEDNRVLVPVRGVFENLGLEVGWKQSTKTATIKDDQTTIEMKLGSKSVKVNGKTTTIDKAVTQKNNRLFIPVRFVIENTGGAVTWDQKTKTVGISTNPVAPAPETVKPTEPEAPAESDAKEIEEFLTKVAQVEVNSFSADMDIKQSMSILGQTMNADMTLKMDMVLDPFGAYQEMTLKMGDLGEDLSMEAYMTKDGYFINDSTTNQWMKFEDDLLGDMTNLMDYQMDPSVQLELMSQYYKDVKLVEKQNSYELHMSISGDDYQELINELLSLESLGLEADILGEIDLTIDKMDIVTVLDKETLYPISGSMDSVLTMVMEGQSMQVSQQADFTYSNFNELTEIKVPQEVIDSAISLDEIEAGQ